MMLSLYVHDLLIFGDSLQSIMQVKYALSFRFEM